MVLLPVVLEMLLLLLLITTFTPAATATKDLLQDRWLKPPPQQPGASVGSSTRSALDGLQMASEVIDTHNGSQQVNRSSTAAPCLGDRCTLAALDVGRIVGGVEANFNAFPWIAGLVYTNKSVKRPFCGGALISSTFIITAAHCVDGKQASEIQVSLLEHNVLDGHPPILVSVAETFAHAGYNGKTYDNDIALIRLNVPATNVDTICLPSSGYNEDDKTLIDPNLTVAGWGTTSEGGKTSPTLRQAQVRLILRSECAKSYPNRITDRMICAGHPDGGRDSCHGDSGGPLVASRSRDKRHQLTGIVSWGIGCGRKKYPGVYTRVSSYLSWIASKTYSEYTPCPT